ncbi:MAG: hypothetical protein PHI58_06580 [Candidatus Omnitrophica bacterium]|nr:hypothetical protein [Candidatus Omnitrophota bacterium]
MRRKFVLSFLIFTIIAVSDVIPAFTEQFTEDDAGRIENAQFKAASVHFFSAKKFYMALKDEKAVSEFAAFREKMDAVSGLGNADEGLYVKALEYMGEIYFNLKMYEEFYAVIQKILKILPEDQAALYNLGVYNYVHAHNNSKAYQLFNKVIALDPDSYFAKKARYAIEFMRANPDSRMAPNFDFIDKL